MNFTKIFYSCSLLIFGTSALIYAQQREIPLNGAYNFRDLGGYKTKDHKTIKWGKLYRSAVLSDLTPDDLNKLTSLHISRIADFRGPVEVSYAPDKIPAGATYFALAAGSGTDGPDDWAAMAEEMKKNPVEVSDQGAIAYYRKIGSFKDRYKPLFDSLLTLNKDSALLFHCVGGKDRTGLAAAFIEYALGVEKKQIIADYVLTNTHRAKYNKMIADMLVAKYQLPAKRAADYGLAKPEFIEATFNEITKKYGSMDNFMKNELGLTEEKIVKLKSLYLE